jgi:hypothetical protein
MKYRIEEKEGIFTPQYKYWWWWVDFGYSYNSKELALREIKEFHEFSGPETPSNYHYIRAEDLH